MDTEGNRVTHPTPLYRVSALLGGSCDLLLMPHPLRGGALVGEGPAECVPLGGKEEVTTTFSCSTLGCRRGGGYSSSRTRED